MTDDELGTLELRIDDLVGSHSRLRASNRKLISEKKALLDRNAELRQRLERIVERLKKVELEAES